MEEIGETPSLLLSTSSLEAAVDEIQSLLRSSTAKATAAGSSTTRESEKQVIGQTQSLLSSTSTLKASVDEIRTLLRPSTAEATAGDSTTRESKRLALVEKLASLNSLSRMLINHSKEVKQAADNLNSESRKLGHEWIILDMPHTDFSPLVVIKFVHLLDQANQYFDFKERAKLACRGFECPIKIYDFLLLNQQLLSNFSKIGKPEVRRAANAIFSELHHEHFGDKGTQPMKDCALADFIYNLVFQTRVKGYVMDKDPVAELEKMTKFRPYLYDNYFASQKLPVECTERLTQEARNKYSDLVSIMMAKYKAATIASAASEIDPKSKRPFVKRTDIYKGINARV